MNGDIIPPKRPKQADQRPQPRPQPQSPQTKPALDPGSMELPKLDDSPSVEATQRPGKKRSRLILVAVGAIVAIIVVIVAAWLWYAAALAPVNPDDDSRRQIVIEPGSSVAMVGELLESEELIRSQRAFNLHARFTSAGARLQAGDYRLSPSESTQEIMEHLTTGSVDEFTLTFLPGATLRRLPGETSEQRTDVKSALLSAGYTDAEIEAAFSKGYDHPLFASKPAEADLEGYIYGETYSFTSDYTVEQVLEHTFDHYYRIIEENELAEGFDNQGLTLYEGITLASVIQREVSGADDQKQVAQIFLDRLDIGMSLGADATFEYGAKKENIPASPEVDSPYNTRKYTGLPPGPIAAPGLSALEAVANPAGGDYLYFVSGDDGTNYFARTLEEHGRNIRQYCSTLCFGE